MGGLLVVVLLAVAIVWLLNPPAAAPDGEVSARWAKTGPHEVIEEDIQLRDESRPTQPNGEFEGKPARQLEGRLWRPKHRGASPLVFYSHGFMSSHRGGEDIGRFLASHGYITVAVDFPLTNGDAPGGPLVTDVINQPQDATFVIDKLLKRSADEDDPLFGQIDPDRIGAAGLSLGGMTTQLIAFHPHVADPRINAALSIAGPTSHFTARFFEHRDIPFLMLAGGSDAIVPYADNALPILDKVPEATLVTLENASHTGFAAQAAGLFRFADHPDELVCPRLLDNLEAPDEAGEATLLEPNPDIGIVESSSLPCQVDEFPRAMRPPKQVMYTRLVTYGFFESIFAETRDRREAARTFLTQTLPQENPVVGVRP
ncbi:MAG: hypothetical protein U5O39_11425 [Gammaproteobacteria bacterium]|nr:hypothetical protein [Gammaproteobacteria bacterium]